MSLETIPLKIYFKLTDDLNGKLPFPRCTIMLNDTVLEENVELDNPSNHTTVWQDGKKISIKEYDIEVDDDKEDIHTIKVIYESDMQDVWDLLKTNRFTGGKEDYGFYIVDIEIDEISIESVLWDNGVTVAEICPESEIETDGFIEYLRNNDMMNEIAVIDGKCIWTSSTTYLNVHKSNYSIEFKCPFYLWLLEELLQ
jgi:hypothetical protein